MEVQHQTFNTNGVFYIESDMIRIGEITYLKYGNHKIIIDSSFSIEETENLTIIITLVKEIVKYANKNDLKVVSVCPNISKLLKETILLLN